MKFTISWLKEHLDFNNSKENLIEALIKAGIEVEEVIDYQEKLKNFSLAYIKHAEKHPNADKLNVCTVATKDGDLQIVCGAHNARTGIYVIYAPINSYIPGLDVTLKKTAIRGVESNGMMLSEKELGISEEHGAIIELPEHTLLNKEIGSSAASALNLDDVIIEISITPNRGDLLSVRGIAKDLAALNFGKIKNLPLKTANIKASSSIKLEINNDISKKFIIRKIINLTNKESPKWLKNRLEMIGLNPKTALVDITNYVMFSLNQPLHCYDYNKVNQGNKSNVIKVDFANNATIKGLDNKDYVLDNTIPAVIINNNNEAIGGILGGNSSGCNIDTKAVLLEAAHFDSKITALAKRKLSINTDSSYRFEREIDVENTNTAIAYASDLILEICGGQIEEEAIFANTPTIKEITIDLPYINRLSGINFTTEEITNLLTNLGCIVTNNNTIFAVKPPSYRQDINDKSVIVAEIVRLKGLDNLPKYNLSSHSKTTTKAYDETFERTLLAKRSLAKIGLLETINMSFIAKDLAKKFNLYDDALCLHNPISEDLSIMRKSIVPSLVLLAQNNIKNSNKTLHFFEVSKIYEQTTEEHAASGLVCGELKAANWQEKAHYYDVWEVKKIVQSLFEDLNFNLENLTLLQENLPTYYHGGKSTNLYLGKTLIGNFGEIHPLLLDSLNITTPLFVFEIYIDRIPLAKNKGFIKPQLILSEFTPIIRDFSFIFNKTVKAAEIIKLIKSVDRKVITAVNIFDIYEGNNIPENKKSVSISVSLQSYTKTFIDEEIQEICDKIIGVITAKLQGELRK